MLKPIREPKIWEIVLVLGVALFLFVAVPISYSFLITTISNFKNKPDPEENISNVWDGYSKYYEETLEKPELTMYSVYKSNLETPLYSSPNLYKIEKLTGYTENYFYFWNPADATLSFYDSQNGDLLNSIIIPLDETSTPQEVSVSEMLSGDFLISINSGGSGVGNFADIFFYYAKNNNLEKIKFDPRGASRDPDRSEVFSIVDYGETTNDLIIKTHNGDGCGYQRVLYKYYIDSQKYSKILNFFVGCGEEDQRNYLGTIKPYIYYSNVYTPNEDPLGSKVASVSKINYLTDEVTLIYSNNEDLPLEGRGGEVVGKFIKIPVQNQHPDKNKFLIINLETNQFEEIVESINPLVNDSTSYEQSQFDRLEKGYTGAFRVVKIEDYEYPVKYSVRRSDIINSDFDTYLFEGDRILEKIVDPSRAYMPSILGGSFVHTGDTIAFTFVLTPFVGQYPDKPRLEYFAKIDTSTNLLTLKLLKVGD